MNKLYVVSSCFLFTFIVMTVTLCRSVNASDLPQPGNRYEIIRTIYLDAWYYDLGDKHKKKQISKKTACAFLSPERYADRVWHAFRAEVPVGTIMTIIGPAPKVRYLFFFHSKTERYFVRLEPDPSRGLDIELQLDRGIEGSQDGLNPDIFRSLKKK